TPPLSTLFPYTTLFRSPSSRARRRTERRVRMAVLLRARCRQLKAWRLALRLDQPLREIVDDLRIVADRDEIRRAQQLLLRGAERSEEHTSELQSRFDLV